MRSQHASAALLVDGLEAGSHHGLASLVSQHLVRTGRLSAASGRSLRRLQGFREAADYDRAFVFDRERAEEEAEVARAFVAEVRALLTAGGW